MKAAFLEAEAVQSLMQVYFNAVYHADVPKLKTLFHEKAAMYGYLGPNMLAGGVQPFYDDLQSQPSMAQSGTDCRCVIKDIDVTGNTASCTLLVDGFYGAACVEDRFFLLKESGEWKISCKSFTTID